jgi:hypothetical protein
VVSKFAVIDIKPGANFETKTTLAINKLLVSLNSKIRLEFDMEIANFGIGTLARLYMLTRTPSRISRPSRSYAVTEWVGPPFDWIPSCVPGFI